MKHLLALTALSLITTTASAQSATAYWNGEIEFVTTVTYKSGVRCGYNYLGQTIRQVFVGSTCPRRIQVQ